MRSDADKDAVRKCVGRVMGKLFKAGNVVAVAAHHVERGARFVQWDNASDGGRLQIVDLHGTGRVRLQPGAATAATAVSVIRF